MTTSHPRFRCGRMLSALVTGVLRTGALVFLLLLQPALPAAAAAGSPTGSWTWPLPGHPPVLRAFEPPAGPYAPGHRGVDLGAPIGTPVLAAGAGVIGYAGRLAGRGVVTVISGPLRTTYEPVTPVVRVGEPVSKGAQIGWLAIPTGHCGPGVSCLHWGLLRGDVYLNPLSLLGTIPVRLLPSGFGSGGRAAGAFDGLAAGVVAGTGAVSLREPGLTAMRSRPIPPVGTGGTDRPPTAVDGQPAAAALRGLAAGGAHAGGGHAGGGHAGGGDAGSGHSSGGRGRTDVVGPAGPSTGSTSTSRRANHWFLVTIAVACVVMFLPPIGRPRRRLPPSSMSPSDDRVGRLRPP